MSRPGARLLAHFTTGSTMHKSALSTPIALLLQLVLVLVLLAVQADARECQETTVLAPDASAAVSTVRTERDLVHDTARGPHRSYAAHDAEIAEAVRGAMLCSKVEPSTPPSSRPSSNVSARAEPPLATAPSSELLSSSLRDVHARPLVVATRGVHGLAAYSNGRHKSGVNGVRPVESNVDSTFVPATAPRAPVSSSTPPVSSSTPPASSSVHATARDPPAQAAPTVVVSSSSHNASSAAISRFSERVPVQSTFLELSSAPTHVDDDSAAPAADSRPTSKATVSTGTADAAASATQTTADASSASSSSSSSSASRLLFYSCLAVGVAGLVGAVLMYAIEYRTGAQQQQRDSDGADAMPRATWAPRPSEVHVVMDGRNFAIL